MRLKGRNLRQESIDLASMKCVSIRDIDRSWFLKSVGLLQVSRSASFHEAAVTSAKFEVSAPALRRNGWTKFFSMTSKVRSKAAADCCRLRQGCRANQRQIRVLRTRHSGARMPRYNAGPALTPLGHGRLAGGLASSSLPVWRIHSEHPDAGCDCTRAARGARHSAPPQSLMRS